MAIPIELRHAAELTELRGRPIGPENVAVHNPAFDVTPARLVTGLITERGVCPATEAGLLRLFPERRP
jgi:methylthioribose-1-phosphate isomerase